MVHTLMDGTEDTMSNATRIETETTHCDGCQGNAWKQNPQPARKRCAKLGPDGAYTLALCADCYPALAEQDAADAAERDELSCYISDTFKDLNGVRPRHINFCTTPIEELRSILARLERDLREEMEAERDEAAFEASLASNEPLSGEGWSYTPAQV